MTELSKDDRDGLAAEYALGTLDAVEKAQAEELLRSDRAFAAEVERWRRRFDPLLAALPVTPPDGVLEAVFSQIEPPQNSSTEIFQLRSKASAWKWTAGGAAAIAASLLVALLLRPVPPPQSSHFVAVLEAPDRTPAFVASSGDNGLYVRRVGAPPPQGRSFELWAIRDGAAPQSLGVAGPATIIPIAKLTQKTGGEPLSKIVLAVTNEPEGGSPTGKPSGAPIFTGKLIHLPES